MRIGVLGTGIVGTTIGSKLVELGNDGKLLGDISTARGPEMYLPLWLRLMGAIGTPEFNVAVAR